MTRHPNRFGPVWLQEGVTSGNMMALILGGLTTIGLLTFIALGTPYVLTVYLDIPQSQQGALSGYLHTFQEVVALAVFAPLGIMADRIGRRSVYVGSFLIMGIGYGMYSYASSVPELYAYRFVYAIGVAGCTGMLGTITADYSLDRSRGLLVAAVGVLNAIGVIVGAIVLGKLPQMFVNGGASPEAAGHDAFLVVAAICVVVGLLLAFGLKGGTPVDKAHRLSLPELVRSGLAEARNPRIALSYACGFIARSDLVLLGTYSVLWGTTVASSRGLPAAEALAAGRNIFTIASTAALLWLFVIGVVIDRVNRVTAIVICMSIASIGYLGTMFVDDPLSSSAIPLFALLGVGQISAFAGAQTLISKEAPPKSRASVIGMFNVFGAAGILVSTSIGGILFDRIGPHAPFVMIGVLTLLLVAGAVFVRIRAPGPLSDREPPTAVGEALRMKRDLRP